MLLQIVLNGRERKPIGENFYNYYELETNYAAKRKIYKSCVIT